MNKYNIKHLNIPLVPKSVSDEISEAENRQLQEKHILLRQYGVYVVCYTDKEQADIIHPDGIHNYWQDSCTAQRLVLVEDKELPEDLKERLLYYKNIMDEEHN